MRGAVQKRGAVRMRWGGGCGCGYGCGEVCWGWVRVLGAECGASRFDRDSSRLPSSVVSYKSVLQAFCFATKNRRYRQPVPVTSRALN